LRDKLLTPGGVQNMQSFSEQARWAKMTLPRGQFAELACHLTKK